MRLSLLIAAATMLPATVFAQSPLPARVQLESKIVGEGKPLKSNMMHWNLYSALADLMGVRAESISSAGKRFDPHIAKRDKAWHEKAPDQPVALKISVTLDYSYNTSKFMQKDLMHNFFGTLTCRLIDPAGKELDKLSFRVKWGKSNDDKRLYKKREKKVGPMSQAKKKKFVRSKYIGSMTRALTVLLVHHPEVSKHVSPKRLKRAKKFMVKERDAILKSFLTGGLSKQKLAMLLKDPIGKPKGGKDSASDDATAPKDDGTAKPDKSGTANVCKTCGVELGDAKACEICGGE